MPTPFFDAVRRHAANSPDRPSLTVGETTLTRAELVASVERVAAVFAERGVGEGSWVTISMPNGIEFVQSALAAWLLGATPQPISHRLPIVEREAIIELADPALVVGAEATEAGGRRAVDPQRPLRLDDRWAAPGQPRRHHAAVRRGLDAGARRASWDRLALPRADDDAAHLASARGAAAGVRPVVAADRVPHGRALPPRAVGELWMRRGGTDVAIPYRYVGAAAKVAPDNWESLGDMGFLDEDGYVSVTDRDTDMILVGGANVFPAEIEAAIEEHPAVRSACVIGLPDEDLGAVPHALVELAPGTAVTDDELLGHVRSRIEANKVPRSIEWVDFPLRDDAGKVRRSALRAERV